MSSSSGPKLTVTPGSITGSTEKKKAPLPLRAADWVSKRALSASVLLGVPAIAANAVDTFTPIDNAAWNDRWTAPLLTASALAGVVGVGAGLSENLYPERERQKLSSNDLPRRLKVARWTRDTLGLTSAAAGISAIATNAVDFIPKLGIDNFAYNDRWTVPAMALSAAAAMGSAAITVAERIMTNNYRQRRGKPAPELTDQDHPMDWASKRIKDYAQDTYGDTVNLLQRNERKPYNSNAPKWGLGGLAITGLLAVNDALVNNSVVAPGIAGEFMKSTADNITPGRLAAAVVVSGAVILNNLADVGTRFISRKGLHTIGSGVRLPTKLLDSRSVKDRFDRVTNFMEDRS